MKRIVNLLVALILIMSSLMLSVNAFQNSVEEIKIKKEKEANIKYNNIII